MLPLLQHHEVLPIGCVDEDARSGIGDDGMQGALQHASLVEDAQRVPVRQLAGAAVDDLLELEPGLRERTLPRRDARVDDAVALVQVLHVRLERGLDLLGSRRR